MRSLIPAVLLSIIAATSADAQTWTDITPGSGPAPSGRAWPSAVFDTQENRMVIFGGQEAGGSRLRDVWAFDLDTNTWEELTTTSITLPDRRRTPVSIYDPATHTMVTWSGQGPGNGFFNDAWSFDLMTHDWTQHAPAGGPPAIRYGAAGVRDPQTGDLVTFGGFTNMGRFDDAWRFNPDDTTWTDVSPVTHPLKRCLHSASYDALNHRLIMYGGQNSGALDDIWAFDLATNTWTDLTPASKPAGRWFAANVYDSANHRVTIFGGNTGISRTNEVWVFDLAASHWAQLSPAGTPPTAREGAAAIHDAANDRMIVFGGNDPNYLNEVWELSDLSDTPSGAGDAPGIRATLSQNFPNPFNPTTQIAFELVADARVSLRVYDTRGQLVRTLVDGARGAGPHAIAWNGNDDAGRAVPSGVYFYRLVAGGADQTRKMVLVK